MFKGERFYSALAAFRVVFRELCENGIDGGNGTKKLYNVGFYIDNPQLRDIDAEFRNWSKSYAEREWYLLKNRSVSELKKFAPIWDRRQAWITIFDGKNKDQFSKDTPCALNIGFVVHNGKLCMSVFMRSNDIWFGFCNDQYCFSKLQELVANELELPIGWYYHHAADMHVYERHYDADKKFYLNQQRKML